MKLAVLTGALVLGLMAGAPAHAQPSGNVDKNAQAQSKAPNLTDFDKQTAQVQENIQKMQEQMDRIRQTQDPQERQKLLQEHWATMQNSMVMMQGMWGPGGMMGGHMRGGPMMGWRGMEGYYSRLTPEQMKQRQYMTDQYMGMQQQMMNHMMMHQNYMLRQPSK
jgi:hypothetical protein